MRKLSIILILWSSISSCGILHKTFSHKKENHSEASKHSLDSSTKKSADSTTAKIVDSASLKKKTDKTDSGVSIEFSDSSDHNKVEVTTDSNGKQVIKAEGNIKSIKTSKKQETTLVDSSHLQKKDTASKQSSEQTAVKSSSDNKQSGSTETVKQKKFAFRIPWYGYLIGILVLIAALIYVWKRYRFQIIAWFIKLLHPGSTVYYDPKINTYQIIYKKDSNTS